MRALRVVTLAMLALTTAGCLNLDLFVFRTKKAASDEELTKTSKIPAALWELVDVPSADGTPVKVFLAKHDPTVAGDEGDPARNGIGILYCHGQSNHIGTGHPRIEHLWRLGYTVAVFDPRGYGTTPGDPTEVGVYEDALAARDFLASRVGEANVALYGRSLGSAICLSTIDERSTKALALESPIGSLQDIVNDSLAVEAPGEWFFDSVMDNDANITKHTGALLVMHGDADDFVQPKYGERIFELSEGHAHPRTFWLVEGATHGNLPCSDLTAPNRDNDCDGGPSQAWVDRVTTFFDGAFRQ